MMIPGVGSGDNNHQRSTRRHLIWATSNSADGTPASEGRMDEGGLACDEGAQ